MASSSASSSFKHPAFLSFRGQDVRLNFADHLYASFMRQGIDVYKDDKKLVKGNRIDELFKAIEDSKLFIIVFSKNYASSSWCLKELAKIAACLRSNSQQTAYPIFYDVDPAEVRKQTGAFGAAFTRHIESQGVNSQVVGEWKQAMKEVGNLVGWDLRDKHEAEAIHQITKEISRKLRYILPRKDENLIGMEPRMQPLKWFTGIGLDDEVRMLGIKGMGGIGKTTLARAIFDELNFRFQFERACFIENVREVSETGGLLFLQKKVLSDILSVPLQDINDVSDVDKGKYMMQMKLPYIKVLLVLDNVDSVEQLEALSVASKWFKGGSRIIITTRNEKVLADRVDKIHHVSLLSEKEANCLFCRHAFTRDTPDQGYEKLSSELVRYAAGLPLTIKVLGSFLRHEKVPVWRDMLLRLKDIPCMETTKVLEISYDGLDEDHKKIFLDVACFMKGWMYHDAIRFLESRGFRPVVGLRFLEIRSLIEISDDQRLAMHDSIEEMGRHIVRRPHPDEPNKHSQLWNNEEIEDLLSSDDLDIEATCMRLHLGELSPEVIMKGFASLKKLKALLLIGRDDPCSSSAWKFDQVKQYFSNGLQYLRWVYYPAMSLPKTFQLHNLVTLEMPHSRITHLWEGGEKKVLKKLRFLDLSYSKLVTLDLGLILQLKWLKLEECRDLVELRTPDGSLKGIENLNLNGCSRFDSFSFIKRLETMEILSSSKLRVIAKSLEESPSYANDNQPMLQFSCIYSEEQDPSSIENGQKSVFLNLQPCRKHESVSEIVCGLQHLRDLTFNGGIPEVPNDLDQLQCLEKLSLFDTRVKRLPDSICMLNHLTSLKLKMCLQLVELPENLGDLQHLEKLSLLSMNIRRLPGSISKLKHLKSLKLKSCPLLEEVPENLWQLDLLEKLNLLSANIKHLPDSIRKLEHLKSLELKNCELLEKLPEEVGQLKCLEKLILTGCKSLKEIPNSICEMKNLKCFHLSLCAQVEKLPEEIGRLNCLEELKVQGTGISHLPHSITSMIGLHIFGSEALLESCSFAHETQTLEGETFYCIQPPRVTMAPTPTTEVSSSEMIWRSEGQRKTVWHLLSTILLICVYAGLSFFMLGFYLAFA